MTNIMNPPADWSTMKKLIWLRGTPINGGEDLTVTGTPPLSLPNSLGKPLKAWSVDLLPYQEGTGDPSPSNVRAIHGTDKLNLFVADSYDPTATPTAVIDVPPLSANQWDEECERGIISWTGENAAGQRIRTKGYIPVVPNAEYYVKSDNSNIQIFYYNEQKEFVSYQPSSVRNQTVTIPSDCYYMRWYTYTESYGTTYNHDISINYPSTVTAYNPYNATVYTATISEQGGESRQKKIVLDGSPDEDIQIGTAGMPFRFNVPSDAKLTLTGTSLANDVCNQLVQVEQLTTWGVNGTFSRVSNLYGVYFKIDDTITTLKDLRTYLASHPIEYVYELATPTTFSVPSVTIPTPTGTASAWATAEDGTVESMEVTYVGKA